MNPIAKLRRLIHAIGRRLIAAEDRERLSESPLSETERYVIATVRERPHAWTLLTPTDIAKLKQPFLTADQLAIMETLNRPDRWQPDVPLNESEAKAWGAVLASPIGMKIDVAMTNIAQQEAQRVLIAPSADMPRQAGVALGYRNAWAMTKSLSTLTAADGGKSEDAPNTASAALAHLAP